MIKATIIGLCAVLMSPWNLVQATEPNPMVVTHPSVTVNQLTSAQLRGIYMMRQVIWPDGSPIRVFVLPSDHELHKQFARQKLQLFPYQLERGWQKLTYSGTGTPPTEVIDLTEMKLRLSTTPGAIGYIDSKEYENGLQILQIKP